MAHRTIRLFLGLLAGLCAVTVLTADPGKPADKKKPVVALPPLKPTTEPPKVNLTAEEETELIAALKESSPDHYYAYLMAVKKSGDAALYKKTLAWFWQTYQRYLHAPPEVVKAIATEAQATTEIGTLVQSLRTEKDPPHRKDLTARLQKAVERRFDAELILRDYRLKQFEDRLAKLRKELAARRAARGENVAKRVKAWLDLAEKAPKKPSK